MRLICFSRDFLLSVCWILKAYMKFCWTSFLPKFVILFILLTLPEFRISEVFAHWMICLVLVKFLTLVYWSFFFLQVLHPSCSVCFSWLIAFRRQQKTFMLKRRLNFHFKFVGALHHSILFYSISAFFRHKTYKQFSLNFLCQLQGSLMRVETEKHAYYEPFFKTGVYSIYFSGIPASGRLISITIQYCA